MSDETETTTQEQPKRGRPAGKTKPARRNYASEFTDLQGRVKTAIRLLERAKDDKMAGMVEVALETLRGDEE